MPHEALLELPSGGDDLLCGFLGLLHRAEDVGNGTLFRERRQVDLKRMNEIAVQSWNTHSSRSARKVNTAKQVKHKSRVIAMKILDPQGSVQGPVISFDPRDFAYTPASPHEDARSVSDQLVVIPNHPIGTNNGEWAMFSIAHRQVIASLKSRHIPEGRKGPALWRFPNLRLI